MNKLKAIIIGAGLAGTEAALNLSKNDVKVDLYEMRPEKMTKAHTTDKCAELVCSNSLRGASLSNAVGLLKEELRALNSFVIQSADVNQVPAGGALAVDREKFSKLVEKAISIESILLPSDLLIVSVTLKFAGESFHPCNFWLTEDSSLNSFEVSSVND